MTTLPDKKFWFVLFLIHLILRSAALYTPFLDIDESQFAGFAHVLIEGGLPYQDSLDTKSLGIYLFYWGCFFLFGKHSMFGVHLVTIFWTFLTAYFLYQVFNLLNQKKIGQVAALFFVIFSTTYLPKYIATSINAIMVLFLVLSVFFIILAEKRKKVSFDILAGLFLGMGFLFKYTAGIQIVLFFLFTMPFWSFRKTNQEWASTWRRWFCRNFLFGFNFVLPFFIQGFILTKIGVWDDFYEWSLLGSGRYLSAGGETIAFWQNFFLRFGSYVLATVLLWMGLILGLKKRIWNARVSTPFLFFLWFALTLIPVCLASRFYSHYFIQLLPSLCGLAAIFLVPFFQKKSFQKIVVMACLIPALFFWILRVDYQTYLKFDPDDDIYLQTRVGQEIKKISKPGDRIYVWGFANVIYFFSERQAASRFLWSDWQTGRVPGPDTARISGAQSDALVSPKAWQQLFKDFEKTPPDFFIDTSPAKIHHYENYPIQNYPELWHYLSKNYIKSHDFENVIVYTRKK